MKQWKGDFTRVGSGFKNNQLVYEPTKPLRILPQESFKKSDFDDNIDECMFPCMIYLLPDRI
jgi:hypothetical protein